MMPEDNQIASEPQPADEKSISVNLKTERYVPDSLIAQYSDAATVLHSPNEFIVSFYLTEFPPVATREELEQVKSARSRCVARVIMSPKQMANVVNVLQQNIDKYRAAYDGLESK